MANVSLFVMSIYDVVDLPTSDKNITYSQDWAEKGTLFKLKNLIKFIFIMLHMKIF